MKTSHLFTCLLLLLALPWASLAASENIRFESLAEIEVQQTNDKGEKVLVREPAKLVVPGTNVIYTNRFTNTGNEPAKNLVITNPVPESMELLAGSVLPESASITYSVDGGKTYATSDKLTITEADGRTRPAEPRDYSHIRWKITGPLPPGEKGQVEFRAKLK